jgi:pyruvate dehydrogenase (quinone)
MKKIASELLVERLIDWGVDTVFGLPGDGINGIMEGLRRHRDRMRFVLVQHEEAAAFMATGYAKSTGRLGVCLATSGPGGLHLLNGLYDAKLDHAPVLAITGMQGSTLLGTFFQQEFISTASSRTSLPTTRWFTCRCRSPASSTMPFARH